MEEVTLEQILEEVENLRFEFRDLRESILNALDSLEESLDYQLEDFKEKGGEYRGVQPLLQQPKTRNTSRALQ